MHSALLSLVVCDLAHLLIIYHYITFNVSSSGRNEESYGIVCRDARGITAAKCSQVLPGPHVMYDK